MKNHNSRPKQRNTGIFPALRPFVALLALSIAEVSLCHSLYAQTPNFTEETVFDVDGNGNDATARSYSDGLGRGLQSQVKSNVQQNTLVGGRSTMMREDR